MSALASGSTPSSSAADERRFSRPAEHWAFSRLSSGSGTSSRPPPGPSSSQPGCRAAPPGRARCARGRCRGSGTSPPPAARTRTSSASGGCWCRSGPWTCCAFLAGLLVCRLVPSLLRSYVCHRRAAGYESVMSTRPVALVAGGSRGLGLLIARELGRRGFQPVLWARDAAELDRAVLALKDDDIDAAAMVCDVSDHELVEHQVGRIEDELGPIEVAVHVAGVIQVGPLSSLTRQHFEQAIDIMQWGPINLALAVVPRMRARGRGRFGTIASIGGLVSVPHLLPYSTAKFGAVGFTNGLRAELAGTGVTATTVAPGLMRTGSHLKAEFTGDAAAEYAWFAPATTAAVMGLAARLLPAGPGAPTATIEGHDARRRLDSRLVERLTTWGNRAAGRNNESAA